MCLFMYVLPKSVWLWSCLDSVSHIRAAMQSSCKTMMALSLLAVGTSAEQSNPLGQVRGSTQTLL